MTLLFFMGSIFTPVLVFLALLATKKSKQDAEKIGSDPQPEETSMPGNKPSIAYLPLVASLNQLLSSLHSLRHSCASRSATREELLFTLLLVNQVRVSLRLLLGQHLSLADEKVLASQTTTPKSARPSPSEP